MNRNQLVGGGAVVVVVVVVMLMAAAMLPACSPATGPAGPPVVLDMAQPPGPGTGGNQGSTDMAMPPQPTSMLPFVVDTAFVSSGFMGDGATAGTIMMTPAKSGDSTDCNGKRASTAASGSCHVIAYAPPSAGGMGWGGVYWQYPANNWGMKAGYGVPAGAKKVTFQAKGGKGGEKVTFLAGGIIGAGNPYTDSIKATTTVTLTADWATYTIDLSGQSYTQVLGGFGWTMTATDAAVSGSFFVDDIQWQ
ncbi:MAG: Glutamate synthase large chain [Myxococcales bacterium]|nr:Glutamate synthase large chain [Myxococcales bacterium]